MKVYPDPDAFRGLYNEGKPQLLWTKLVADLETPVSAFLKLADGRPYSLLFESVENGDMRGRYSFIGLKPDLIWKSRGQKAEINRQARSDMHSFEACPEPALESLRKLVAECQFDVPDHLPPMASGLFGYMGYDTVRLMEQLPDNNPDVLNVPDSVMFRPTVMAIFDTIEDMVTIITPVWPDAGMNADTAMRAARERLADIVTDFSRSLPFRRESVPVREQKAEPVSNMTREEFHAMVAKAKDYILAGDAFQIVGSQRYTVPFDLPPLALYRSLRRMNPSPFLFILNLEDFAIIGSSPEILVRLRDGEVTIRPLAGTRKRGATPAEDKALADDLLNDPKELAEHLMLLDLGRNDVGRVSKIGSVEVTGQFMIENYSHVMHIVSNVKGEIQDGLTAMDALIGGFPAGTVSGAPKVRAMEIIDELEPSRRGVYAGAVGYFAANGSMDTCIALRTAVLKQGQLHVQAGVGIVADSDPEAEYQESRNKAMALLRSAEDAIEMARGE